MTEYRIKFLKQLIQNLLNQEELSESELELLKEYREELKKLS